MSLSSRHTRKRFPRETLLGEICPWMFCFVGFFFFKKKHRPSLLKDTRFFASPGLVLLLGIYFLCLGLPGFSLWSNCGLAVKTACGEHMAPTEVAASVGGGKAVPGFSCYGHLHAQGCRDGHRTHIQGLKGWVWRVEGWTSVS